MASSEQTLSIKRGYVVVVRPKAYEVTVNNQVARLSEISAVCKEAGCRKVLVLGPQTKVRLSTMDLFALGAKVAQLGLRVAVVESHDATSEDVRFLENVATNRGSPMQFFDNEQDAKNWLEVE